MGCGCGQAAELKVTAVASTRAAMCHTCIWAEHDPIDPWGVGAVSCTINGESIQHNVMAGTCEKNKYPDSFGRTRWLGILWWGVPFPIRVWLWATHPNHRRPSWFAGCGCIVRLKAFWTMIRGKEQVNAH